MSAPESVVRAVQEAHDAHYVIGWDAEAGMTCNCGATFPDGAWSKHAYETFADAAWAAAYPAALRDTAERLEGYSNQDGKSVLGRAAARGIASTLRRWADESGA